MARFWQLPVGVLGLLTTAVLLWRYGNESILQIFLSFAVIAPLAYLTIDRLRQQNALSRMKEQALRAELASLQSQVDPHFFFNTLNNLYGLTVAGSPKAGEMILKLSDLMRFTIYEGRKTSVPVSAEIEYLRNYLDLMGLRAKTGKVKVDFATQIENDTIGVPPLMAVLLIENAFKHGAATLAAGAVIRIDLNVTSMTLEIKVANNFDPAHRKQGKGIGLENLKRRLALRYPGPRHELRLQENDDWFSAQLRIDLRDS